MKKILIMGLPHSGKTTLANELAPYLNAVHFNADAIRAQINKDLGFSVEDRIEQARRMGWLCDQVVKAGHYAIADFVCPTEATRAAFGYDAHTVFIDTGMPTPYADTKALFERPTRFAYRAPFQDAEFHAKAILAQLQGGFDWRKPTALFLGRYQPFHDGHKALVMEGLDRVGQACIAVRDTQGTSEKDPFDYEFVKTRIETALAEHLDRIVVIKVPNITNIMYGRDVGYQIERIDLPDALQAISATKIRAKISATMRDEPDVTGIEY
jgi:adenylylsulfate kinase